MKKFEFEILPSFVPGSGLMEAAEVTVVGYMNDATRSFKVGSNSRLIPIIKIIEPDIPGVNVGYSMVLCDGRSWHHVVTDGEDAWFWGHHNEMILFGEPPPQWLMDRRFSGMILERAKRVCRGTIRKFVDKVAGC